MPKLTQGDNICILYRTKCGIAVRKCVGCSSVVGLGTSVAFHLHRLARSSHWHLADVPAEAQVAAAVQPDRQLLAGEGRRLQGHRVLPTLSGRVAQQCRGERGGVAELDNGMGPAIAISRCVCGAGFL